MPIITYNGVDYPLPDDDGTASKVPSYNETIQAILTKIFGAGAVAIAARVYHSANQSIANTTATVLAFNSERFDTDAIHDNSTNNSRLTCKTAGLYLIACHVDFAVSAVGSIRQVLIKYNGTDFIAIIDSTPRGGSNDTTIMCSTIWPMSVNDYVEAFVYQDSGGALNVVSSAKYAPEFMMTRLGS